MKTATFKQTGQAVRAFWRSARWWVAALLVGFAGLAGASAQVVTLAGFDGGYEDGDSFTTALFNRPAGIALNNANTILYVADQNNNAVREMLLDASPSTTLTFTGVKISQPVGVLVDATNNVDVLNHGSGAFTNGTIVRFNQYSNYLGTLASNLVNATAMTMDGLNNLYVTVQSNRVIKVAPNGVVSTVVIIPSAIISTNSTTLTNKNVWLMGIAVLGNGLLAVTDAGNNGIWLVNPVTKIASQFTGFNGAGSTLGIAADAQLYQPYGIAYAGDGFMVVSDYGNDRVVTIDPNGTVQVLYGIPSSEWIPGEQRPGSWDGNACDNAYDGCAEARNPYGVTVAQNGDLFSTEIFYDLIRQTTGTGFRGPGPTPAKPPIFNNPDGVALDNSGDNLYFADKGDSTIQVLNFADNATTIFLASSNGISSPSAVAFDDDTNLYVLNEGTNANTGSILEFNESGTLLATNATGLSMPTAMAIDPNGNIFVSEQGGAVQEFSGGVSNTIATITNAGVSLQGIALFEDGTIAVSDAGNDVVWQINPLTGAYSLLAGMVGVPGANLSTEGQNDLDQPHQLSSAGRNQLIAADTGNNRIVVIQRSGAVTNVLQSTNSEVWFGSAGDPYSSASPRWVPMTMPVGVTLGANGTVYSSEDFYGDIRGIAATGLIPSPLFDDPQGLALDSSGSGLYIADQGDNTIKLLDLGDNSTTTFLMTGEGINRPAAVAFDTVDNLYVLNQGPGANSGSILEFDVYGNLLATNATGLSLPTAFSIDLNGNFFVAEQGGAVLEISGGIINVITTITTNAQVSLQGLAQFNDGTIAVSDAGNDVVWAVNPVNGAVSLLAGKIGSAGSNFGPAGHNKLNQPHQMGLAAGDQLFTADTGNNRIVLVERTGAITNALVSTNSDVWFGRIGDPYAHGTSQWVAMASPVGVALAPNGTVFDSEDTGNDIRGVLATGLTPPPPPVPAPGPEIGWVDFQPPINPVSVLVPGSSFVFNNDAIIAIKGVNDSEIFYNYLPTSEAAFIVPPSATNGFTAPFYQDGDLPGEVPASIITPTQPDVTIEAVGVNPGSPNSPIVTTRVQFITGSPVISGGNGAQFTITDITTNAVIYYTTDGSNPNPTNLSPSNVGPINAPANLSINASTTNITFKVAAFKTGYQPSPVQTTVFSSSNFVGNAISFGFQSGEASSQFIASPGQFFYAPVTMNVLGGTEMYSLQFNMTVTNVVTNALGGVVVSPAVPIGDLYFQSMLMTPDPSNSTIYYPIPPGMTVTNAYLGDFYTNPPPANLLFTNNGATCVYFTNVVGDEIAVGWLERLGQAFLYPTLSQDLIQYSQAHDDVFPQAGGKIIVGGFAFRVPANAVPGNLYQIQLNRPSATSDGIGAPGAEVYIATPTTGSLSNGAINSVKNVAIGQRSYIVGDSAPFGWFNAGDFGNGYLQADDVAQVFEAAVYALNAPPIGSDFFDSMDSCCGLATNVPGTNLWVSSGNALTGPGQNELYAADDSYLLPSSPVQVAFGDGKLDVTDVYVTWERSEFGALTWFQRFWLNGQRVAQETPNVFPPTGGAPDTLGQFYTLSSSNPAVAFYAGDAQGSGGQTVQIPITARTEGSYPLRVLMLNLTVNPLDGAPPLTSPVQFKPTPALGAPYPSDSNGYNNYAAAWLSNNIPGLSSNALIGTLSVTIPSGAGSMAAYAVHFDHASGSPNGLASFPVTAHTGVITLSDRSSSYFNDGIPDLWRLRYFGTAYNVLSMASADADGDGANNWQEYEAGTDPNDAQSVLRANAARGTNIAECVISWPAAAGTNYVVQRSTSLYGTNWTPLCTNTGTGFDLEFHDITPGIGPRFYRVHPQP